MNTIVHNIIYIYIYIYIYESAQPSFEQEGQGRRPVAPLDCHVSAMAASSMSMAMREQDRKNLRWADTVSITPSCSNGRSDSTTMAVA